MLNWYDMVRINTICFRDFALVIDKKYCCSNYASLYNSTLSQILLKKSNSHQQLKKGLFLLIRVKTFFNTFFIPNSKSQTLKNKRYLEHKWDHTFRRQPRKPTQKNNECKNTFQKFQNSIALKKFSAVRLSKLISDAKSPKLKYL